MNAPTHIDHIAIVTENLDDSLAFFATKLGLTVQHVEDLPERGIRVAMLPLGNCRIELIQPLRDDSEVSAFLKKRGPGLHHLCLGTSAVDDDVKKLRSDGITFTTDTPEAGAHGCRVAFVHPKSTGGVLVELSQALRAQGTK